MKLLVRNLTLCLQITALLALLPTTGHAQNQDPYRLKGLRTRITEDTTYRNRFIAGSIFIGILLLTGIFVLSKPNQKGPRPQSG